MLNEASGREGAQPGGYMPEWFKTREAAAFAGVSVDTIERWLVLGLPASKPSGALLISRGDLDAWIRAHPARLALTEPVDACVVVSE